MSAALFLSDVIFVGHSVSGMTSALASIERPELFKNLIQIGPSPCYINQPPDYTGGFEHSDIVGLLDLMDKNYIGWANFLAPVIMKNPEHPELGVELVESFCSTDPVIARCFAEATFTVRLPVTSVRRSESFAPPQNAGADNTDAHLNNSHNLQGLNILIVGDDHDGRYMMETLLSMYGAKTFTAASVAEAFHKIETRTPDLVISDIEMPGEDGFSLIKKLTAFNENQKRKIPAVALTGHAGQEEKLKVLKAGFQVHLAKPIELEKLLVVIANLANWNNE